MCWGTIGTWDLREKSTNRNWRCMRFLRGSCKISSDIFYCFIFFEQSIYLRLRSCVDFEWTYLLSLRSHSLLGFLTVFEFGDYMEDFADLFVHHFVEADHEFSFFSYLLSYLNFNRFLLQSFFQTMLTIYPHSYWFRHRICFLFIRYKQGRWLVVTWTFRIGWWNVGIVKAFVWTFWVDKGYKKVLSFSLNIKNFHLLGA